MRLAVCADIHSSTIPRMEKDGFVRVDTGAAFASELRVDATWLFWGTGDCGNDVVRAALAGPDGDGVEAGL